VKSDVMSGAGLTIWAEIALLIFAVAFLAVLVHTFAKKRKATFESISRMPLDDEKVCTPREGANQSVEVGS
jgi:cbb3-type cytochrome oxidase subunit 3